MAVAACPECGSDASAESQRRLRPRVPWWLTLLWVAPPVLILAVFLVQSKHESQGGRWSAGGGMWGYQPPRAVTFDAVKAAAAGQGLETIRERAMPPEWEWIRANNATLVVVWSDETRGVVRERRDIGWPAPLHRSVRIARYKNMYEETGPIEYEWTPVRSDFFGHEYHLQNNPGTLALEQRWSAVLPQGIAWWVCIVVCAGLGAGWVWGALQRLRGREARRWIARLIGGASVLLVMCVVSAARPWTQRSISAEPDPDEPSQVVGVIGSTATSGSPGTARLPEYDTGMTYREVVAFLETDAGAQEFAKRVMDACGGEQGEDGPPRGVMVMGWKGSQMSGTYTVTMNRMWWLEHRVDPGSTNLLPGFSVAHEPGMVSIVQTGSGGYESWTVQWDRLGLVALACLIGVGSGRLVRGLLLRRRVKKCVARGECVRCGYDLKGSGQVVGGA